MDVAVSVAVTRREKQQMRERAAREGKTLSAWSREVLSAATRTALATDSRA